jgi:hypothetical protein
MQWLGRSTTIVHPLGGKTKTPLLVPSFSSRGFAMKKGLYSIRELMELAAPELHESVLISAYDIGKRKYPPISRVSLNVDLSFVDSGGYEAGGDADLSSVHKDQALDLSWTAKKLERVYDRWPRKKPAVFVNFDHVRKRKRISQQIKSAKLLFANYPKQLHCFLIKPETRSQDYLGPTLQHIRKNVEDLRGFSIIGMTEKELGDSFLERMKNISELRLAMDGKEITAPIHVFGSLDPLSSCLYFLAGAEIFDGLTWLRYAYSKGNCIYRHNYSAMGHDLELKDAAFIGKLLGHNLSELRKLQVAMRLSALEKNFDAFLMNGETWTKPFADKLSDAYKALRSALEGKI